MSKLFISCPMKGLSGVEIAELRAFMLKQAMIIWPEETFEVLESAIPPEPGHKHLNVHCLGRSIQLIADADYYIGIRDYYIEQRHKGCQVENEIARHYLMEDHGTVYVPNVFFVENIAAIPAFHKVFENDALKRREERLHPVDDDGPIPGLRDEVEAFKNEKD